MNLGFQALKILINVSSLMDQSGGKWDIDILKDMFEERDKRLIINIPISNIITYMNYFGSGRRRVFIQ